MRNTRNIVNTRNIRDMKYRRNTGLKWGKHNRPTEKKTGEDKENDGKTDKEKENEYTGGKSGKPIRTIARDEKKKGQEATKLDTEG